MSSVCASASGERRVARTTWTVAFLGELVAGRGLEAEEVAQALQVPQRLAVPALGRRPRPHRRLVQELVDDALGEGLDPRAIGGGQVVPLTLDALDLGLP